MKKNVENPSWIHPRCSRAGRDVVGRGRKKDEKSWGLCLKAERDHHHRFAVVCAVRRHIRYGAAGKPETTLQTLELRGDGCESCINKKRISKQVYKIHIFFFSLFFTYFIFLSFLSPFHLLRPQSSSPAIPPSHPISSRFSLEGTDWMRATLLLLSLSFKKVSVEGNSMIYWADRKRRGDMCELRLWRQLPRDSACVCVFFCVRSAVDDVGVLAILFEKALTSLGVSVWMLATDVL